MNEAQQNLADRIGELLAESPMDDELKNLLIENMEKTPEHLLFRLKDALETEQEELENITFEIKMFLKDKNAGWANLAKDQQKTAEDLTNSWAEKLK